jgi:hypothetical protein
MTDALVFLAVGGLSATGFLIMSLMEGGKKITRNVVVEATGVTVLRKRLNAVTQIFVHLGSDPYLARAGSKTENPVLSRLTGETLRRYTELANLWVATSFGHSACANNVIDAERETQTKGVLKLLHAKQAATTVAKPITFTPAMAKWFQAYGTAAPRNAPASPSYSPEHVLDCIEKMCATITSGLQEIRNASTTVEARLAKSNVAVGACEQTLNELARSNLTYSPYQDRKRGIDLFFGQIKTAVKNDPMGGLKLCTDLDNQIAGLQKELQQVQTLLAGIDASAAQLVKNREYVTKVRATQVVCPWAPTEKEPESWKLTNAGSNPDTGFAQGDASLSQARSSLAAGQLKMAADERKEADTFSKNAVSLVSALFQAKGTIDEQVPKVQMELASLRGELSTIRNTAQSEEMSKLVTNTCEAVDQRLREVLRFYRLEKFHEALALLSGAQGTDQGMPISKLVAQAKDLLRLLKEANKAAEEAQRRVEQARRDADDVLRKAAQGVR